MNLFNRGKKTGDSIDEKLVNPSSLPQPQTPAEYLRRGYAYYARSRFEEAEADFKQAVAIDANAVDALYALGMNYKAQKKGEDGIQAFQKTIELIDQGVVENRVRADMLRRLAQGHINEIKLGDWNLEHEIWKKEP